jgi:hypothetical protein
MVDDATKARWQQEYGELFELETEDGPILFRGATENEFIEFQDKYGDPKKRGAATRNIVRDVVLYPPPEAFSALLKRRPGLPNRIGNEIANIANSSKLDEAKKVTTSSAKPNGTTVSLPSA